MKYTVKDIVVEEQSTDEIMRVLPHYGQHLRSVGVVAVLTLVSGPVKATSCYRFKTGRYQYIAGSKSLYDRFIRELRTGMGAVHRKTRPSWEVYFYVPSRIQPGAWHYSRWLFATEKEARRWASTLRKRSGAPRGTIRVRPSMPRARDLPGFG